MAGWTRVQLADKAGVAAETVKRFELRGSDPKVSTMLKIRRALEAANVEFVDAADGKKASASEVQPPLKGDAEVGGRASQDFPSCSIHGRHWIGQRREVRRFRALAISFP